MYNKLTDMEAGFLESEKPTMFMDDVVNANNVLLATIKIRMGFLRKVYTLLTLQLMFSTVAAAVCVFNPLVRFYVHNNDWLLSVAFLLSVVTLIALHVKKREVPTNYILLAVFTVVQSYSVGVVITYYDQLVVLQAFLLTAVVTFFLTALTFQIKYDFSVIQSSLFAGLWILIVGGILQILIGSTLLETILSLGGALLFSLFIIYDTQLLMRKLSPEEYIFATINLYLDIINLFLYILRILQAFKRHN